jgi:hypothetical protein
MRSAQEIGPISPEGCASRRGERTIRSARAPLYIGCVRADLDLLRVLNLKEGGE